MTHLSGEASRSIKFFIFSVFSGFRGLYLGIRVETGGGPDYWKPALKQAPLDALLALGYQPLRYRGMAREAVPAVSSPKEVLSRAVKASAVLVPNPTVGEP